MTKLPAQGDLFSTGGDAGAPKRGDSARAEASPSASQSRPEPAVAGRAPVAARERRVLSVTELTRKIKATLEKDFAQLVVRGEVSNFRGANARGHLYFVLKDAEATVDARIWQGVARALKFRLKDGLSVVVEGYLDLYEPSGRYSLIVQRIEPEGVGARALAFEQLKERLVAERLIGEKRRRPPRPLPFLPRRIGVVTSVTGAALKDFLRVLHQRHPRLSVLVCDARVQGEGAQREVVRALQWLGSTDVDVIVLTRGGGSVDDLWTFNEEAVARAIHASPVPVVSAIGHEIDTTIADLIADYRAPTPSAAAERLAPVLRELEVALATWRSRVARAATHEVVVKRQALGRAAARLADPHRALGRERIRLGEGAERLERALRLRVRRDDARLRALLERVQRAQPTARLARDRQALQSRAERLARVLRLALRTQRERWKVLAVRLDRRAPRPLVDVGRTRLVSLAERAQAGMAAGLAGKKAHLHRLAGKLDAMSPLRVMARGYAVVFRERDGRLVRSADDVREGDRLAVRVAAAEITSVDDADSISVQVLDRRSGSGGRS